MNETRLSVDYKRAREVSQAAVGLLNTRQYPFDIPEPFPDAIVPQGMTPGSLEHALFLFYACNFDSAQKANIVYEEVRKLTQEVEFRNFPLMSSKMLHELFKKSMQKMGDPAKARLDPVNIVMQNAAKLELEYGGDPRNIAGRTIGQTLENIQYGSEPKKNGKFKQYGAGKAALLMKNFVRFGMWGFSEYEIPIKVDRHLLRISVGTGVLKIPDGIKRARIDRAVKMLTRVYQRVTSREKISAVNLNDALWAIGAYTCIKNDDIYCSMSCPVGCTARPEIDERMTWYYPGTDKRRNQDNLFRFANEL